MKRSQLHAAIVDTKWGQGLAYLDHDDEAQVCLRLRLWIDQIDGPLEASMALSENVSTEKSDDFADRLTEVIENMDSERFHQAMSEMGVDELLANIFQDAA